MKPIGFNAALPDQSASLREAANYKQRMKHRPILSQISFLPFASGGHQICFASNTFERPHEGCVVAGDGDGGTVGEYFGLAIRSAVSRIEGKVLESTRIWRNLMQGGVMGVGKGRAWRSIGHGAVTAVKGLFR